MFQAFSWHFKFFFKVEFMDKELRFVPVCFGIGRTDKVGTFCRKTALPSFCLQSAFFFQATSLTWLQMRMAVILSLLKVMKGFSSGTSKVEWCCIKKAKRTWCKSRFQKAILTLLQSFLKPNATKQAAIFIGKTLCSDVQQYTVFENNSKKYHFTTLLTRFRVFLTKRDEFW